VADERAYGGVNRKARRPVRDIRFGACLGLQELLRRNWNAVVVASFGFQRSDVSTFLTGGWAAVRGRFAVGFIERFRQQGQSTSRRFSPLSLFLGGCDFSLLGLLPALAMSSGSPAAEAPSAARVYAYFPDFTITCCPIAFHFDLVCPRTGVLTALTLFRFVAGLARWDRVTGRTAIRLSPRFTVGAI